MCGALFDLRAAPHTHLKSTFRASNGRQAELDVTAKRHFQPLFINKLHSTTFGILMGICPSVSTCVSLRSSSFAQRSMSFSSLHLGPPLSLCTPV